VQLRISGIKFDKNVQITVFLLHKVFEQFPAKIGQNNINNSLDMMEFCNNFKL